jgi:hypothetical protein
VNVLDSTGEGQGGLNGSQERTGNPPMLGRKSVLIGMLTSGFVIANTVQPSDAMARGTLKTIVATQPADAPKWTPNTAYALGQQVISPNNDVASAKVAHTSSAAYTSDALKWALSSTFGRLPGAAEQVIYVTVRGSDANDGQTPKSALLTIAAALTALGGNPGTIQLGVGTITTSATHTLPNGTRIIGAGRSQTFISYTGTGTLFQTVSGTRTYNQVISNMYITGPGSGTATTCIDIVDASTVYVSDFDIHTFGTCIKHRSVVLGGSVYNSFSRGQINACGVGVAFSATGSNGSHWRDVKFGACTTAVSIVDSNENSFHACQFEGNTTAVSINSTLAGLSDNNSITECRFEGNTTAWTILNPTVRDTYIVAPKPFDTYTFNDAGTRTVHINSGRGAVLASSKRSYNSCDGSYTLLPTDDVVKINGSDATAHLPSAILAGVGRCYTIMNQNATSLTVDSPVSGYIQFATSKPVAMSASLRVISDGTNWWII